MEDSFKKTNTYKFFFDLVWDVTEDDRTNGNKEFDFNKTIDNMMSDDNLWQELTNAVWQSLVEIEREED